MSKAIPSSKLHQIGPNKAGQAGGGKKWMVVGEDGGGGGGEEQMEHDKARM